MHVQLCRSRAQGMLPSSVRRMVQCMSNAGHPAAVPLPRSLLVSQRLGNMATTGKIANRTAVVNTLRTFLAALRPELVAPVFTAPKGGDAQNALQVGAADWWVCHVSRSHGHTHGQHKHAGLPHWKLCALQLLLTVPVPQPPAGRDGQRSGGAVCGRPIPGGWRPARAPGAVQASP